jgi:hypothetical protein
MTPSGSKENIEDGGKESSGLGEKASIYIYSMR